MKEICIEIGERDKKVIELLIKYRCMFSRTISVMAEFYSQNYVEKRLLKLYKAGYIKRTKLIIGMPYFYTASGRAIAELGHGSKEYHADGPNALHEATVAEIAAWMTLKHNLNVNDIKTDRLLRKEHSVIGQRDSSNKPDLYIPKLDLCVEYERISKQRARLREKIENDKRFGSQVWVVNQNNKGLIKNIRSLSSSCSTKYGQVSLEVLTLEEVKSQLDALLVTVIKNRKGCENDE